jgi:hypothetical protein
MATPLNTASDEQAASVMAPLGDVNATPHDQGVGAGA